MSNQKTIQKQAFLTADKKAINLEEYQENIKYAKMNKRLQKKYGKNPAEKLKKEIMAKKDIDKRKGRPDQEWTDQESRENARLLMFDQFKQSRISRWQCPTPGHGRKYVLMRYQKSDGVHIRCLACGATTHFDETHYQGTDYCVEAEADTTEEE